MTDVLDRYFSYLMFRRNDELQTKPLPSINRKMLNVMKEYYKIIEAENGKDVKKEIVEDTTSGFEKLAKKMDTEIMNAP